MVKGQGNDVKMVDIEHEEVGMEKPPPVNWLNYRAPAWVKCAVQRAGRNGGNASCVFAVGTGEKSEIVRYE